MMRRPGYVYVCTPYTIYPGGIEAAFHLACVETAKLIRAGIPAFSPIAHSHAVAVNGGIDPHAWQLWMEADTPLLEGAAAMVVVCAEGWEKSKGIQAEMKAARRGGQPIYFMHKAVPPELIAFFGVEWEAVA